MASTNTGSPPLRSLSVETLLEYILFFMFLPCQVRSTDRNQAFGALGCADPFQRSVASSLSSAPPKRF